MSPSQFNKLTMKSKLDLLERVEGMPYYFGLLVKISEAGSDVLKFAHSMIRLPDSAIERGHTRELREPREKVCTCMRMRDAFRCVP